MGLRKDLRYFAPRVGALGGLALMAAKVRKRRAKSRLAVALRRPEPEDALLTRLGLSWDPALRLGEIREAWAPLVDEPAGDPGPQARAVREGRQHLFGRDLEVGWPPAWDWRWDGTPNARDFAADVRSTWEIQRLQGILPLARAARLGAGPGAEAHAGSYLEAIGDFAERHPGPGSPAWESALEVGLRLLALAQGLPLVAESEAFARRHLEVLRLLDRHARWLAADLSLDKVVRGNHLLGELAGLLAAGMLLPRARTAWWGDHEVPRLLESEILVQFHSDGVNVEQSLTYEKFILEFLTLAGDLARLRDEPLGEPVRKRLLASADHLASVITPDGSLPRVGDCDSGRGADWGEADPHDPRSLVERVYRVFGSEGQDTELLQVPAGAAPGSRARISRFPQGGHVAVELPGGHFLFVRGGPFGWGPRGPASHSHADWLAPVLFARGEPLWVDPGVYGYGVGEALRNAFREWSAHNTLYYRGCPGPVIRGPFRWDALPPPARMEAREDETGIVVEGRVRWGPDEKALLWHRSMRYNELDNTWLIRDRTSGDIMGPIWWAFHFAPGIEVEDLGDRFRLGLPSGREYLLELEPRGHTSVERGWVAPAYGDRVDALVLRRRLDTPPERSEIRLLLGTAPDPGQETP